MPRHDDRQRLIVSLDHPLIRPIHRLRDRAERDRRRRFVVDGIRFVLQALRHGAGVEALVVAPGLLTNPLGQRLVAAQRHAGRPCLTVTDDLYRRFSPSDAPQGLSAVIGQRWTPLNQVDGREGLCWVVLETVQAPGNLGTIIRTAEAVGAAGLILIGDSADPYHPAAVRATMGALFAQRLIRTTLPALLTWKERQQIQVVGAAPAARLDYRAADYRFPLLLVMGWERRGLSARQQDLCDLTVRLPMVGSSDSLNLAVATGVMLYTLFDRRQSARI
jgi:TrmH family RNA methyltransferase